MLQKLIIPQNIFIPGKVRIKVSPQELMTVVQLMSMVPLNSRGLANRALADFIIRKRMDLQQKIFTSKAEYNLKFSLIECFFFNEFISLAFTINEIGIWESTVLNRLFAEIHQQTV